MPLKTCTKDGKSGWQWGDSGACYTGKDGKKKALMQGYAIDPKHFKEEVSKSKELALDISQELTIVEQMMINLSGSKNE